MFRYLFALLFFAAGAALVTLDSRAVYLLHEPPHYAYLGLGCAMLFTGGYVLSPAWADRIAAEFLKRFGDYIPTIRIGGRRATDPPAEASGLVAQGTVRAVAEPGTLPEEPWDEVLYGRRLDAVDAPPAAAPAPPGPQPAPTAPTPIADAVVRSLAGQKPPAIPVLPDEEGLG